MNSAILLAAGTGTKVWPYGEYRQKCVIPVANTSIIRKLVIDLQKIGIEKIFVIVGHHKQQVFGAVAELNVKFIEQKELDGTATAALLAAEKLDEDFLIVYGDVVTAVENLEQLIEKFNNSGAEAAAMVNEISSNDDGQNWLCADVNRDKLTGIEGHPRGASYQLCGIYAMKNSAKDCLLRNPGLVTKVPVGGMPQVEAEVAQSIQVLIDDGREVLAVSTSDFFVDVDKPWHILEANKKLGDYLVACLEKEKIADSAKVSDAAEINGKVLLGENSIIGPRVVINGNLIAGANNNITNGAILKGNILVGDSCRISNYCLVGSSVVGNDCVIGHGAEMSGVMMDKVYLYHYCEMYGIFGTATDIGGATVCGTLRFDDGDTIHNIKGRKEIPSSFPNAAYIGDYCRTGVNAIIMPGRKVGSYSVVGPGVILYDDVPSKTMVLAKQEIIKKPWGPEMYGW